jgi:multidrug efflux system membrane fusion protein
VSRAASTWVRIAVSAAAIAGLAWWFHARGETKHAGGPATGSADVRPIPVQTAQAARRDLPIWVEGLGSVAAFQQVTVRPQVDGRLDKVMFTEGQLVKKGEPLAQIDPRPIQVQLHQAQGALARDTATRDTANRTYERDKTLHDQNLIAQATVDNDAGALGQAEGAIKIDQAAVESAQLQLDYALVKSPLDGLTGVRMIDAGNIVHAADPTGLVVITAIDPAAVFFTIPQELLPQIVRAQQAGPVRVEVSNRNNQKLADGTLALVDNQINQTTATLRLKALVPNQNRQLWPNAFVKARALVEIRKDALVVPAVAIQRGPQGTYVYVVGPDSGAQMMPVDVTIVGEQAIIDKGLTGGEQVVTEGQNQLRPGAKVQTSRPDSGPPPRGSGSGSPPVRGSAAGPTASNKPAAP